LASNRQDYPAAPGTRREPRECEAGVIENGSTCGGQLDASHAPGHQRGADLVLEIPDLPAQRRLRRVQLLHGGDREAARLGDGDEIAQMPQLQSPSHACEA
jgi:hypothetical protein